MIIMIILLYWFVGKVYYTDLCTENEQSIVIFFSIVGGKLSIDQAILEMYIIFYELIPEIHHRTGRLSKLAQFALGFKFDLD